MKKAINQATLMKTPMETFLKAASAAGFTGVELRRDETFAYLEKHSVEDLRGLLETNGLEMVSWNAIELFSLCSQEKFDKILEYTRKLMDLGARLDCDLIIAVPSFLDECLLSHGQVFEITVDRLKVLRTMAREYSFKVGFEPLGFPTCSVRELQHALKIIAAAETDGLPRSGLVVDTFHFFLGGHVPADLLPVPADRIWLVHFDDSVQKPLDKLQDEDRVWPGLGFFELDGFVSNLRKTGYDGYVSLELFNPAYWQKDPAAMARTGFEALSRFV